jgi:aryl-alcohol dehydrogenase-like predicted oxidoreductase
MRTVNCEGLDRPWSVLTFGCWQIAPSGGWGDVCSSEDAEAVVKTALDGGITAFDTAEGYGDGESERRLGRALGIQKYDVLVISKIWPDAELTLEGYEERLNQTLRALARDYVDVYLVHWPGSFFNSTEKSNRLADIMVRLQESGKTKTIGLSNFAAVDLDRLGPHLPSFSVNQIPYSLLEREYEGTARESCQNASVGYMAYSPTGRGLLAGRLDDRARNFTTRRHYAIYQEPLFTHAKRVYAEVTSIAEEAGTSPVNVALAWVLAQPNIVTAAVGSRKVAQVAEFVRAADLELKPDQLQRLNKASDDFHLKK